MKIIKPSYEIIAHNWEVERIIEEAARICYLSEPTEGLGEDFIRKIIKRGHHSVLEHGSVTVDFIIDRGVSHELVRHRVASFSQESSRFCDYSKDKFDGELTFIEPCFFDEREGKQRVVVEGGLECAFSKREVWETTMMLAEQTYLMLLKMGAKPEEARSVLPNSLKTKIRVTANIREWRHIFTLRCASAAHPQMREIMRPLLGEFTKRWPCLFEDIIY